MATELVPFAPAANAAAAWGFLGPEQQQENLADGIAGSYGLIGYKGKTLSLKLLGNTYYFTRPDDNMPAQYLHFVIIGSAPHKSRAYFEHYVEGSTDAPLCTSMNGVNPDAGVQMKQADVCALCPRSQWYPNPEMPGKKKRDCNEYKRLAILLMYSDTQRMLGTPLAEPVFLRVPAGSLQNLASLGNELSRKGFHFARVVVRMTFDPAAAFPKMVFQAVQEVPAQMAGVIREMMEDQLTQRILGLDTSAGALAAPQAQQALPPATGFDVAGAPGGNGAPGRAAPQSPPQQVQQPQQVAAQQPLPPRQPAPPPAPVLDLTVVATAPAGAAIPPGEGIPSFLQRPAPGAPATGVSAPPPPPPVPPPNPAAMAPAQAGAVQDTGEPVASTADIDALVAKFMPKT